MILLRPNALFEALPVGLVNVGEESAGFDVGQLISIAIPTSIDIGRGREVVIDALLVGAGWGEDVAQEGKLPQCEECNDGKCNEVPLWLVHGF